MQSNLVGVSGSCATVEGAPPPLTLIHEYIRHPESKSLGSDGERCHGRTAGLLEPDHVHAGRTNTGSPRSDYLLHRDLQDSQNFAKAG